MNKKILLASSFILFFILFCPSVIGESFKAGDTIYIRYPASGMGTTVAEMPKFVRYTLKDPSGNVVYEGDHQLTYKKEILLGFGWEWYDEYYIRVPGFAEQGVWTVEGRVYSEFLWVIEDPQLFPRIYQFEVTESSLLENLLAPSYITWDMGILAGRISFSLPVHWSLILVIVAIIIIVVLFTIKKFRDLEIKGMIQKNKNR